MEELQIPVDFVIGTSMGAIVGGLYASGLGPDEMRERIGEIDWAAMGQKKWAGEVQHFLCAMLAHDPAERPASLDIANVLGGVATVAPGDDLTIWSDLVLGVDLNARWDQDDPGAAGGLESVITTLAVHHGVIPPTINLEHADEDFNLDFAPNTARERPLQYALNNSFGFGGHNVSLAFARFE